MIRVSFLDLFSYFVSYFFGVDMILTNPALFSGPGPMDPPDRMLVADRYQRTFTGTTCRHRTGLIHTRFSKEALF